MSEDSLLLRELKTLREEISASRKERSASAAERNPAEGKAADVPIEAIEAAKEPQLEGQLREVLEAIKEFGQTVEENATSHPAATAVGALIIGILIGRLIGRR